MDLEYFKQIEIEPLACQHGERNNAESFLKDYVYINILGKKVLCRSAPITRLFKLLYSCIWCEECANLRATDLSRDVL